MGQRVRWVHGEEPLELDALACTLLVRPAHLGDLTAMLPHVVQLSLKSGRQRSHSSSSGNTSRSTSRST